MPTRTDFSHFSTCAHAGEIATAYKKLVQTHHPDRGGDADTMKAVNAQFDQVRVFFVGKGESQKSLWREAVEQQRAWPAGGKSSPFSQEDFRQAWQEAAARAAAEEAERQRQEREQRAARARAEAADRRAREEADRQRQQREQAERRAAELELAGLETEIEEMEASIDAKYKRANDLRRKLGRTAKQRQTSDAYQYQSSLFDI